jgi:cellulose synthase (UDP-forming)
MASAQDPPLDGERLAALDGWLAIPRGWGRSAVRRPLARSLVVAVGGSGLTYLAWRLLYTINWAGWYIAVPLMVAEVFSYVSAMLFGLAIWRMRERGDAPAAPQGLTVDVLITCYDEPAELVRQTVRGARAITYLHRTFVLDDGASPEMERMAREEHVGYVTRGAAWTGKPRHAKAGNLSNALFETTGEFLLVLDADQVPSPRILDRTLGYFADHAVAIVQTPQYFYNVPPSDPLGSQAPLFYGPIQEGKDGWGASFYCGSNAVLRREALMRLGVLGYVSEVRDAIGRVLSAGQRMLRRARRQARATHDLAAWTPPWPRHGPTWPPA